MSIKYHKNIEANPWEEMIERGIIHINDEINEYTGRSAIQEMTYAALKKISPMRLLITSPGGSVFDGLAVYDYARSLVRQGIEIYTIGLGWTASMGGILLQAGSRRYMHENAWLMIHEITKFSMGKTSDIQDEAKFLERMQNECLIPILTSRSKMSPSQLKVKWKRKDWWLSSHEALELGFCDEVIKTI